MRYLVVGLGSMGKRRVRCLKALNYGNDEIGGFDLRDDRRQEVRQKYSIRVWDDVNAALKEFKPDVFIISVPPDVHHQYMKIAANNKIDFFVEASVVDTDYKEIIDLVNKNGVVGIPSATMIYHPAIAMISKMVKEGQLGKISNITYHSGQYLPDWHTYEKVANFYVSNPATGGCREIVPFELTWIVNVFGFPKRVMGNYRKTINIEGAGKIDDTYNCLLDYNEFLMVLTVDVVSRHATRRLLINGSEKQLLWNWEENNIKIYEPKNNKWMIVEYAKPEAAAGYNPNIGEGMYIEELRTYISCVENKNSERFNSMENDWAVLKLLYQIEKSDDAKRRMNI